MIILITFPTHSNFNSGPEQTHPEVSLTGLKPNPKHYLTSVMDSDPFS